jgi:hypothetical protein
MAMRKRFHYCIAAERSNKILLLNDIRFFDFEYDHISIRVASRARHGGCVLKKKRTSVTKTSQPPACGCEWI